MSRKFIAWPVPPDPTVSSIAVHWQPLKDNLDLFALGAYARNLYGGGSETIGFEVGQGTGWLRALEALEFELDDTNSQISGASNVIIRCRVMVRVETGGISVTPRVVNTDGSVPTQTGAVASSGTASDYSGTNQKQTILFTPKNGVYRYVPQIQKSADTEQVWLARVAWDCFING